MGHWKICFVYACILFGSPSICEQNGSQIGTGNLFEQLNRNRQLVKTSVGGRNQEIIPRSDHIVYEAEITTPKTVILLQPQALPPEDEEYAPAFLPSLSKHFVKRLKHAHSYFRHRMKKLYKLFSDLLINEPEPVDIIQSPPPPTWKVGVPAVKVEAYEEEPPKTVKIVHNQWQPEVIKYVEAPKKVKVFETYEHHPPPVVKYVHVPNTTPKIVEYHREFLPKEVVKFVADPPVPVHNDFVRYINNHPPPVPPAPQIVKHVEEYHHYHRAPLKPLSPPLQNPPPPVNSGYDWGYHSNPASFSNPTPVYPAGHDDPYAIKEFHQQSLVSYPGYSR